jgi:hypothetical protein
MAQCNKLPLKFYKEKRKKKEKERMNLGAMEF